MRKTAARPRSGTAWIRPASQGGATKSGFTAPGLDGLLSPSMNALLDLDRHPVVGHRGASGLAPENTLGAFELALSQGADALELDVRVSADGVPVVVHDATL